MHMSEGKLAFGCCLQFEANSTCSDIDPALAKSIALGNHDPATYLPIKDINPGFLPRTLKPLHMDTNTLSASSKGKGKMRQCLSTPGKSASGILSFFGTFFLSLRLFVAMIANDYL